MKPGGNSDGLVAIVGNLNELVKIPILETREEKVCLPSAPTG